MDRLAFFISHSVTRNAYHDRLRYKSHGMVCRDLMTSSELNLYNTTVLFFGENLTLIVQCFIAIVFSVMPNISL